VAVSSSPQPITATVPASNATIRSLLSFISSSPRCGIRGSPSLASPAAVLTCRVKPC
jgi:hypothetical protein